MKPEDYLINTIYLRKRGNMWECIAKSTEGYGMMLENLANEFLAIKSMTFLLWGLNEFGKDNYGTEMEKYDGAPEGVEFPVVLQDPIE